MDILEYTEEHKAFRKKCQEVFAREVTPFADQWEKDHIVPKEVWRKLGEEGLLCAMVPKEYGGLGGDFRYALICFEEIAKTKFEDLNAFDMDGAVKIIEGTARSMGITVVS